MVGWHPPYGLPVTPSTSGIKRVAVAPRFRGDDRVGLGRRMSPLHRDVIRDRSDRRLGESICEGEGKRFTRRGGRSGYPERLILFALHPHPHPLPTRGRGGALGWRWSVWVGVAPGVQGGCLRRGYLGTKNGRDVGCVGWVQPTIRAVDGGLAPTLRGRSRGGREAHWAGVGLSGVGLRLVFGAGASGGDIWGRRMGETLDA
jgi:hypothetical protein